MSLFLSHVKSFRCYKYLSTSLKTKKYKWFFPFAEAKVDSRMMGTIANPHPPAMLREVVQARVAGHYPEYPVYSHVVSQTSCKLNS
jgi:hypothetical protein